MKFKDYFGSLAMVIGTAVGAGIFGLPYAIAHIGLALGFFYFVILGGAVILITLAYGEVILRTNGKHQFSGYSQIYLGKIGRAIAFLISIFGITGALIAYTIEVGTFSQAIFSGILGGTPIIYSLVFFFIAAGAVYSGLGMVVKLEKLMVIFLLLVILIICVISLPQVEAKYLIGPVMETNYLLPYGIILFAIGAASIVPELKEALKQKKAKIKEVIVMALIFTLTVYYIFTVAIIGVSGESTTESAILGVSKSLGQGVLYLGAIFGILAMSTSFLALGLVLRDVYISDLKFPKILAWFFVFVPPLIIVLLHLASFIEVIGLVGAVLGSLEGSLILLIWIRARKFGQRRPEYKINLPTPLVAILLIIFLVGFVLTLYDIIR